MRHRSTTDGSFIPEMHAIQQTHRTAMRQQRGKPLCVNHYWLNHALNCNGKTSLRRSIMPTTAKRTPVMITNNGPASHRVSREHPSLPGHFPNKPIAPGVVILSAVFNEVISKYPNRQLCGIKKLKFLYPLQPEQTFTINYSEIKNNGLRFKCWTANNNSQPTGTEVSQVLMAEGHLKLKPPRV